MAARGRPSRWHTSLPRQVDPATCPGGTLWLRFASAQRQVGALGGAANWGGPGRSKGRGGGLTIAVVSPKSMRKSAGWAGPLRGAVGRRGKACRQASGRPFDLGGSRSAPRAATMLASMLRRIAHQAQTSGNHRAIVSKSSAHIGQKVSDRARFFLTPEDVGPGTRRRQVPLFSSSGRSR
jgi:hypothetical protein